MAMERSAGGSRPEVQVEPSHYVQPEYDSRGRFVSYWHQVRLLRHSDPTSVLEVGVGNRFLSDYLEKRGMPVVTVDVDPNLGPDVAAAVTGLPFAPGSFPVAGCFQVLEHLPFEAFTLALEELKRVVASRVVLSLPDAGRAYRLEIQVPGLGDFRHLVPVPFLDGTEEHEFVGEHYWEINKRGYPLSRVVGAIREAGLGIRSTFRVFEHPYHRFFDLTVSR